MWLIKSFNSNLILKLEIGTIFNLSLICTANSGWPDSPKLQTLICTKWTFTNYVDKKKWYFKCQLNIKEIQSQMSTRVKVVKHFQNLLNVVYERSLTGSRLSLGSRAPTHNGMWTSYLGQGHFSFPQELHTTALHCTTTQAITLCTAQLCYLLAEMAFLA